MDIDKKTRLAVIICGALFIAIAILSGCPKPSQRSTQAGSCNVDFMLEHDGRTL
jgi:hypothetical protein